jgi:hypothetical protein
MRQEISILVILQDLNYTVVVGRVELIVNNKILIF